MIEIFAQVRSRALDERLHVIGMIEKWRLDLDPHFRRKLSSDLFYPLGCALETRHGIMRKQRDQQEIIHAFVSQAAHSRWNRWILIAHRQFNRNVNLGTKRGLKIPAGDDQR